MSQPEPKRPEFTIAEFRAFKLLAIVLAMIAVAIGYVSRSEAAQLLAIALAAAIMIAAPLAVRFYRRGRIRK